MKNVRNLVREFVKSVIRESYDDIAEIIVRARVAVAHDYDPTMLDILTDIRGLPNVITVKQVGELGKQDVNSRQFVTLRINFIEDEEHALTDLLKGVKSVSGIDLVRIVSREGERLAAKKHIA